MGRDNSAMHASGDNTPPPSKTDFASLMQNELKKKQQSPMGDVGDMAEPEEMLGPAEEFSLLKKKYQVREWLCVCLRDIAVEHNVT